MTGICPNPPFWANGSWCGWTSQFTQITNSSDPVSSTFGIGVHAIPILMPCLAGALYVFLWVRFGSAPTKFKFIGISALMLVISVIMAASGFTADALINFAVFGAAYFLSFLFDRR